MIETREMRHSGRRRRFRHVLLALVLLACGGTVGKRTAGGESHFLESCPESCGSGLECIAGLCTRGCLVDESDCSDLSPRAVCTNQSVEPGHVAVCDLACDGDRDCDVLGRDFRCSAGFCRLPSDAPPDNPPAEPPGMGGGGGEPSFVPFAPQCTPALSVQSECSFEDTCAVLHCGDGFSQFGKDGCTRFCEADTDCGPGERCRHTILVNPDACPSLGSEVGSCEMDGGNCYCPITDDCVHPSICVDAALYPESQDCPVDGATCAELDTLQASALSAIEDPGGADLIDKANQCLARIGVRRDELACGPNRQIPFAPECAEPVSIPSNCGFEATCAALGCGDGLSQFDENGCTRYCQTTADCGPGQRCRHTRLVVSEDECPSLGSEVENCSLEAETCECSISADCPHPDICVDATKYPESLDCAVEGASCQALAYSEFELQLFLDGGPASDAASEAQTCLDAIRAQQQAAACSD